MHTEVLTSIKVFFGFQDVCLKLLCVKKMFEIPKGHCLSKSVDSSVGIKHAQGKPNKIIGKSS